MRRVVNDINGNKWLLIYSLSLFAFILVIALLIFVIIGKYDTALSTYETIREYAFDVTKIIGIITVIVAVYQLGLNRKKLNFDVIESCISRFKEIQLILDEAKKQNDKEKISYALDQYVQLVNEELFYMANDYIPYEVSKEWVDGMIDYMPILNKEGCIVNYEFFSSPDDLLLLEILEIIKKNPRIYESFKFDGDIKDVYSEDDILKKVKARKILIGAILDNLNKFNF